MAFATGGGNALPICLCCEVLPPTNVQLSGNPCIRATILFVSFGIPSKSRSGDESASARPFTPTFAQALRCLRCGGCLYECPVFALTAGHFGDKYFTGIGAVWAAMIDQNIEKAAAMAYTCLTCGRCKVRCPMDIDCPEMCIEIRKMIADGS